MADQYVIATRYVRPDGREVVHVYGSWPTRALAAGEVRRMKRAAAEEYSAEECAEVSYYVRKVSEDPR